MKFLEKHPLIMIVIGIAGISLSAIFVKYSQAPSVVTAFYRLMWTVVLMTPVVFGRGESRRELMGTDRKSVLLCALSGLFLAMHFTTWFESLNKTSVASSTAIVCTEVIWVAIGYCLFLKGKISPAAAGSIFVTVGGSLLIALSDYSAGGNHLLGDVLALAAAVFCAVYTLIGRQARGHMSTTVYTYIVYVFCALALGIATAASGLAFTGYGARSVIVGLLLSVCSTLLGHSIFSCQAVRTSGGGCDCPVCVWGGPGPPPDSGGSGYHWGRIALLPCGKERKQGKTIIIIRKISGKMW